TASGKSAVAVALARRLGDVELVSVDSMQVYRGMDIGTAKPTAAERAEVPYHLLDLVDPEEDFSVARFQAEAARVLAGIEERGHRALLVGGTGLYLQAVVDGLTVPGSWPRLRAELETEAATPVGIAALYQRLAVLDPPAASRIEPANARRIVRALEVTLGGGRPFSSYGPGLAAFPPTRFRLAGIWLPRSVVAARVEARYTAQLAAGFLDEVRALAARPGRLSRTARQALGYRELLDHVAGKCSLEQAVEQAVQRTRAFARRQRMWFRRDPRIVWFGSAGNPFVALPALLEHWAH
ncbi:MAG: tRNA (adenosine(37)-N6)-dimethylallyltransferase MiaA, partial [Actinomycetota bacterium]|nr:tRNA (adenosine(37)-N6)-dimethylallyltransferase MiaA [Actinomycetota bacterium]